MKGKHKQSQVRREQIIQAGLFCFTKNGYTKTTMAEICRQAKASTGSVYHHCKSKEQLAAAVYLEGICSFQVGFIETLLSGTSASKGIKTSIGYYINWVKDNPDWANFLFYQRQADFMQEPNQELKKRNKIFVKTISDWFEKYADKGVLKKLTWDIFIPLLFGPCQEYTKYYLAGNPMTPVDDAVKKFGTAAWNALKK